MNSKEQQKKSERVFEELAKVPRGSTISYKELGRRAGISAREVGRIIHTNPDPEKYPCHRVIHSDGTLAEGYAFGGKEAQRKKLQDESVNL